MEIRRLREGENPDVVVLMGGTSSEREVSLKSGQAVFDALINAGINARSVILNADELPDECLGADVVFPVLHGGFGENGGIQKCLENVIGIIPTGLNISSPFLD